ncbi:MAG: hypothetical protein EXS41_11200 [Opitutaceae bacterium]|nr:hypothetical protein [Opitutaceae bacterium]
MPRPTPRTLSLATRLTAALGAALVLVLTILAVSPALHAWVHAEPADFAPPAKCSHGHHHHAHTTDPAPASGSANDDSGCIVNLFAQGGSELVAALAVLPAPRLADLGTFLSPSAFCAPSAPAHLLPPCCGPPQV